LCQLFNAGILHTVELNKINDECGISFEVWRHFPWLVAVIIFLSVLENGTQMVLVTIKQNSSIFSLIQVC